MNNHTQIFYWMTETVSIRPSEDKTYFTLRDKTGNEIIFYDDDKRILFRAFKRACPQAIIEKL